MTCVNVHLKIKQAVYDGQTGLVESLSAMENQCAIIAGQNNPERPEGSLPDDGLV
jgi:hypothetical protein